MLIHRQSSYVQRKSWNRKQRGHSMWSLPDRSLDHFYQILYFVHLFLHIFIFQKKKFKKFNPLGSPGTAVFIMRKNALSAEIEVCIIFYISITIEARDSNEKPICSWYGPSKPNGRGKVSDLWFLLFVFVYIIIIFRPEYLLLGMTKDKSLVFYTE
jgi:hypothetical protein